MNPSRQFFTKYGMHLNLRGKHLIAKQITLQIYKLITKDVETPITLEWKSVPHDNPTSLIGNEDVTLYRTSTSTKRITVMRQIEFLWLHHLIA
jgi:hypothetical protein